MASVGLVYENMPECPVIQKGDEWHPFVIPAEAGIQITAIKSLNLDARWNLSP
jgi:hypothetical protein